MKVHFYKLFVLSTAFAMVGVTFADTASAQRRAQRSDPAWLIVGGIAARPDYEGSDHTEAFPIGAFNVHWASGRYLRLSGARSSGAAARLTANLLDSDRFDILEMGPILQYRAERDDVDSNAVENLGKVDAAFELGGFAALKLDPVKLSVSAARDVSDSHDGAIIELAGEWKMELSKTLQITSGISSTWASDDYMKTYFGVSTAGAVASGLDEFSADEGFKDVGLRFTGIWAGPGAGWEHIRIMGLLSLFRMLDDAQDSPVVDDAGDENQFFGGIAVGWEG